MKPSTLCSLALALALGVAVAQARPAETDSSVGDSAAQPQSSTTEAAPEAPALAPLETTPSADTPPPQWQSLRDNSAVGELPAPDNAQTNPPADPWDPFAGFWDPFANDPFFQRRPGARSQAVYDPWRILREEMERMHQLHEQMMQQFGQQLPLFGWSGSGAQVFSFSTSGGEIEDKGDHYEIQVQISGLNGGSTSLNVEGNQLVLRCVQQQQMTQSDPSGRAQAATAFTNNIERRWTLPSDVDRARVEAHSQPDGLLITLPKIPGAQTRFAVPIR